MVDRRRTPKIVKEAGPPKIRVGARAAGKLSQVRREQISTQVENGLVKEAGNNYDGSFLRRQGVEAAPALADSEHLHRGSWMQSHEGGHYRTSAMGGASESAIGAVAHSESYMQKQAMSLKKTANISIGGGGSGTSAGQTVERLAPEVYSPLFTMANLNLPRDRITINAWVRNYFDLHPIVRNAITLHATYPISKLNIKCSDKKVLQFFEDMIEEMNLFEALGMISLEFWKHGEVFPYAELNEETGKWNKIVVQNPDYVHVKKSVLAGEPVISMKPDAVLQRLALSNNPADVAIRKQIPDKILHPVRMGKDIPLDNFNVSHLKMLSAPYDVRGTSIVVSAFKDLMLYDKLREAKFAQADSMVNPITVVKVGGNADGDYRATQEDLEFFRTMLEEAQYDKDFKLITHAGVTIERIGSSGQVLDIASDMELIIKNIYTGLMVPPAIIDTESAVYASASIGLEVLRQRYFNFRTLMAQWLQNKIFAPIAEIQDFYTYEDGRKKLIVPEVEWNQMNLYDLQDYIGNITGLLAQKQVSLQTVYKSLGLNYDDERIKLRKEMINDAVRMKEEQSVSQMTLTELRSLDPEKEVLEPIDDKQREQAAPPGGAGMGADMGMGMGMPPGGDMGMGMGMPPGGDMGGGMGMPELAPPPGGELGPGGGPPGGGPLGPGGPGGPPGGGV